MNKHGKVLTAAFIALAGLAQAADYYVSTSGDDANAGAQGAPFASIDKAVTTAVAGDTIYVAPGEYQTTTRNAPTLVARLVGTGDSRDDVVIATGTDYRALKLDGAGWLENVTIVGQATSKTSLGGSLYMTGGTVTNCVIRGGTASTSGGNVFIADKGSGTLVDCLIRDGYAGGSSWETGGGNVYVHSGATAALISRCTILNGSLQDGVIQGGGIRTLSAGTIIENCLVAGNAQGGVCVSNGSGHYNNTVVGNGEYGYFGYNNSLGLFVNNVVYDNATSEGYVNDWKGNKPASANMYNCAFTAETITESMNSTYANLVALSSGDFVDAANGDYRLVSGSAAQDAGATDSRPDASAIDLDGNPRTSGQVDIGCYEHQKSEMTVSVRYASDLDHLYAPVEASFIAETLNAPDGVATFTFDFGDGSETVTTTEQTVSHTYEAAGVYTVSVSVSVAGETARMTNDNYVTIRSRVVYVNRSATPTFPYATPETGYGTVAAAVADSVDGNEIRVLDGTYEQNAKISIAKAITLTSDSGKPESVVLRNSEAVTSSRMDRRVLSVENANAVVSGVTLENGQIYNQNGGNLAISAGMVSNCVIRGGIAYAHTNAEFGMGGGVVISGSGVVTHCAITNNTVKGNSSGKWIEGGAVLFYYGSKGTLSNCLVAGNTWEAGDEDVATTGKGGTAGVTIHGDANNALVENCTIAGNTIAIDCAATSAAGLRTTWREAVRNTVIAGNRITGASESTTPNVALAKNGSTPIDNFNTCVTEEALPTGNTTCSVATLAEIFKDYGKGDYQPKIGGALADKGAAFSNVPRVDLAGNMRVMFKAIDVGCYEAQRKLAFVLVVR